MVLCGDCDLWQSEQVHDEIFITKTKASVIRNVNAALNIEAMKAPKFLSIWR